MTVQRGASSYETLKLIEADGSVGVWDWDIAGNGLHWSPGLYRILGLDPHEAPSFDLYTSLLHPDDRVDFSDPLSLVADGTLSRRRFRILPRHGGLRWVESRSVVTRAPDGRPIRFAGVVRDVTDLVEAVAAFQGSKRRLDALATLLDLELWTAGPDGSTADSAGWRRKTGQTGPQVAGWGRLEAVHPDDRDLVRARWREAIEAGDRYSARYRLRRKDGRYVGVHSRGLPIRGTNGEIEWWHGVCGPDALLADDDSGEPVKGAQVRAARGLLDWSIPDLAGRAGVSVSSVRRAEAEGPAVVGGAVRGAITAAFAREGVFFRTDAGGTLAVVHAPDRSAAGADFAQVPDDGPGA